MASTYVRLINKTKYNLKILYRNFTIFFPRLLLNIKFYLREEKDLMSKSFILPSPIYIK